MREVVVTEPASLVSAGIDEDPEMVSGGPVDDADALGEHARDALPERAVLLGTDGDD